MRNLGSFKARHAIEFHAMNAAKNVLVLADPSSPQLTMLGALRDTTVVVGRSVEAFSERTCDAEIILNWSGTLPTFRELFRQCPALKWVHTQSAGLERSLCPELIDSSVILTNGTGVFSAALGEFTLAAILYFAKDFRRMIRNQVAGVWEPFHVSAIEGRTLGIVGYGDIGRAIASRAYSMGMKILAVKRHVNNTSQPDSFAEKIYRSEHLTRMLSCCDYVVVAAPLTPQTRGMIGKAELAGLKPDAVLINVGRGPVIDEKELVHALLEGRIKGAALDVFDQEPLPAGHPFYKLENVLLSPHCADNTSDWLDRAMQFFIVQLDRFQKGEPLANVVEKELGY
jgi:phosphoglycerate dehydrogenase-like enzyme